MYDVYLITNRINGKRYVGITCRGYQARFQEHINEAMNGSKTMPAAGPESRPNRTIGVSKAPA